MILLLDSLDLKEPFYFVADAYYASGKIVRRLLARGNIWSRVSKATAWPISRRRPAAASATAPGQARKVREEDQGRSVC